MPEYTCELCKKTFAQKNDYTRHKKKKAPCISIDEIKEITEEKKEIQDSKTRLSTIFKYCLDVLRNNEHLTGDKALRTLAHLLDLRLLEPQFGTLIDIDSYDYDFSEYEDSTVAKKDKEKLLYIARFSNLAKEKEENIHTLMKLLWDKILSVHPITKNIFLKEKGFDIQHQSTYKKLIDKLSSFDFQSVDEDILGETYEEVIKDVMTGKVLGQFFTPPKVKQMMVQLIDPQLNADGTIEKIFDPAMGTGGFLITSLRYLLHQSKTKNINMDWKFISSEGLGGREAEPDTYQLAVSNMLISSGHMFRVLEKGDSIRNPITNKYDIVLANPPFGIDGLNYTEILDPLRDEYLPIKSSSAVPLFLQAMIYMLKINGRCAVVLPNGKELFGKQSVLVDVREYLMKTCDLKEIIYLPAGVFTHTPIKTCVFYFIKKREGSDVLKTTLTHSKTSGKETSRKNTFTKTHQTSKVKFYDYNTETNEKHLLVEADISKIAQNQYALNYSDYVIDEQDEVKYDDGIEMKTLGEVCTFLPKSKRPASYGSEQGSYPFFKSSMKISSYVNQPDYKEESLIIGDGGEPNINYGTNFSASDHCYILQNKASDVVNLKYVYYHLFHNLNDMGRLYTGMAIKNISKTKISNMKIPVPSLERQREIVAYCDNNVVMIKQLEDEIEMKKSQATMFMKNIMSNNIEKSETKELEIKEAIVVEETTTETIITETDEPEFDVSKCESYKLNQLKEFCKKYKLKVTGTKSVLCERLKERKT
jgi:Type I restriction-modification system methyltransferase subunit